MRKLGRGMVLWVLPLGLFLVALSIPSARDRLLGSAQAAPAMVTDPSPPVVVATTFEQLVTTVTAFFVKPFYMSLALVTGIWLWRKRETDLSRLRWGFLVFFAGEAACAIRWSVPFGSDVLEMGHGLGMVAVGALLPWGLFELFDQRVLAFSNPERTCAFQRLCQRCWKREAVRCGLHRIMRVAVPFLAMVALVPLSEPIQPVVLRYQVFGTWVIDETTPLIAVAQGRLYPLMALWMFAVTWLDLRKGSAGIERAKLPFFAGFGFLAYALLRFLLHHAFGEAVFWANAWEELTELATIVLLVFALWAFRVPLGLGRAPAASTET
jgi:hypothetical protein